MCTNDMLYIIKWSYNLIRNFVFQLSIAKIATKAVANERIIFNFRGTVSKHTLLFLCFFIYNLLYVFILPCCIKS